MQTDKGHTHKAASAPAYASTAEAVVAGEAHDARAAAEGVHADVALLSRVCLAGWGLLAALKLLGRHPQRSGRQRHKELLPNRDGIITSPCSSSGIGGLACGVLSRPA